ncbi:MAG: choice-of-anchor D domain-containing protein [Ignavibacteriota bacterium]
MRSLRTIVLILLASAIAGSLHAQHWKQVFSCPTVGSAAYFFNPDVGCIGTGNYPGGYPAQIYFTNDGGTSWTRAQLPNMDLFGQVTDIYFTDTQRGWATIRERIEHGWSGLYRTLDGGKTWKLWFQAQFPVTIRENSNGIFFTDRFIGIRRSTDGGITFPIVADANGILGLDFLDDNVGIASGEGSAAAPVLITRDGGNTWNPVDIPNEAWTAFADVATGGLLFASERNPSVTTSGLFGSNDLGATFTNRFSGPADVITGGMAGPRWCRSVIYAQGQDSTLKYPGVLSMLRSVDGGFTWVRIGGPRNFNDKRFAVTGKGAVVYTFDKGGGVWKTSDGGDGTLTASALGRIFISDISQLSPLRSKLCDSADYLFQFTYSDCDSLIISNVAFLDDNLGELSAPVPARDFGKDRTKFDTLVLRFKPRKIHAAAERVRVTIRQPDGFVQDTIINIQVEGLSANDAPFLAEAPNHKMDFGRRSICGDDSVRTLTITNTGCATMSITSLGTDGSPFNLLSSFQPFTLDPGVSRKILLQFQPRRIGLLAGILTISTADSVITISLSGEGIPGARGFRLSAPVIISTTCDSSEADLIFKNISCTAVRLDSFAIAPPFHLSQMQLPILLGSDSSITLHIQFTPVTDGSFSGSLVIHSYNNIDSNDVFDTTLTILASALRGVAELRVEPSALAFGAINTCIFRELSLTISNTGCDTLHILDNPFIGISTGYSLITSAKGKNILRGDSTTIILRFQPNGLGVFAGTLRIMTNAGERDIPLSGIGTSDPGDLIPAAASIGSVLTCGDSAFVLKLNNSTCDSLYLDSITFSGIAIADYRVNFPSGKLLGSGGIIDVNAKFTPQSSGVRAATVHWFLHRSDGSMKEVTLAIGGIGVQPNVIQISLPNITLSGRAGSTIRLPIQLLDTSIVEVRSIQLQIDLNSNLLEPQSFDLNGSVLSGVVVSGFGVTASGVTIDLDLPKPQKLFLGLLGTVVLHPFLSDSAQTNIVLSNFVAYDSLHSNVCLPTSTITPPQITTDFLLSNECGDSTLSEFLRSGSAGFAIERITPNPTSGLIAVTIKLPPDYRNNGTLELFNALGEQLSSEAIISISGERKIIRNIEIPGSSGLHIVRIRSAQGVSSQSVYLLR